MENVTHILFECPCISESLSKVWISIRLVAPQGLVQDMAAMTPNELTSFWLSGFICTYMHEWEELYCVVCMYIYETYQNRMREKEIINVQ